MARKTLRQLAQEKGWTPEQIEQAKQILGLNSSGDLIDENDARLQPKAAPKRPVATQSDRAPDGLPVMFTEVGEKIDKGLDPVAKKMRRQAQHRLEQKIVHYMHVPSDALDEEDESIPDNFGFFSQVQGIDLTPHLPGLGGSSSQTPQLMASSPTSQKNSMTPSTSLPSELPTNTET